MPANYDHWRPAVAGPQGVDPLRRSEVTAPPVSRDAYRSQRAG